MFGFLQLHVGKTALRRTLLLMALSIAVIAGYAQDYSKMSISTQMFLDRINGKIDTDDGPQRARARQLGLHPVNENAKFDQFVADPDTINGMVYMSAFVRIDDASAISELEALGVIVQEQFLDGKLVTTLIPIDKIEAVSSIAKVNRVNAATMMRTSTNTARQKTNVDDVLTYSADAQSAGLPSAFDGSGVVLGVIDTGIDFNHIAFKDASGNSRIKQAYVYNGSSASTYTGSQITSNLTDDKSEDHGTHTSSTAGGSSVTVSGTTVTVTDNHANATYGGMAPGADLYLAGIKNLNDTYLTNAVNNMCTYANNQGKPLVVSNSWGSQIGPHDGTGDVADIYNSLFGDSHPNRVALFAASNDGGKSPASEAGGFHVRGTTSSSNPLGSILRCHYYSDTDNGFMYNGVVTNAWFRSTVSNVTVKVLVLNSNTGAKLAETTVTPTSSGASVSGLSTYYSGSLYAYKDYISASGKTQVMLYGSSLQSRSYDSNYNSNYTLAIQIYPNSGSAVLDMWGGNTGYFTSHLTTSGYTWTNGSDDMCVSDESMIANVISVGAYATKNGGMNTSYTIGDIADFSSWATASASPDGNQYPWITAPGARLIAGVNHNHTSSVDSYSYYGSNFKADLVVNSSTNPYAYMEGTSMATPTAAGIVALWMQASKDENAKDEWKNLTVNKVKQLMAQTAIHDSYTNGTNASHFGNGKIDALAGIAEILETNGPKITATPTSLAFGDKVAGTTNNTMTFTVTGTNLEGNISLSSSNSSIFSVSPTSVSKSTAEGNGATITVTFKPTANVTQNYTGTITLTSGTASTTVSLSGRGVYTAPSITASPTSVAFGTGNYTSQTYTKTVTVTGSNLQGNISAAISGTNAAMFSVSPTSITNNNGSARGTVTITYSPTAAGSHSANLVLTTTGTGANTVTVPITGTATGPSITANPTSLNFTGTYAGETATKTFTVTGVNLSGAITATLNNGGGIYSIDKTTITKAQAEASGGATITVTYAPTAVGQSNASVTLSSTGCNPVTVSLSGTALGPNISASPESLAFTGYTGQTYTKTVAVTGNHLSNNITATLSGANIYSIDKNSLTSAGGTITVTYAPTERGNTNATLTLSSANVDDVVIDITGQANGGTITATPTSLSFSGYATRTYTNTFSVTGANLEQDITATLNDANGVYSIDKTSISKTANGVVVTVTYAPQSAGNHNASVTLSSRNADNVTINLIGTAQAATPTLIATPSELSFSANAGENDVKTFNVTGRFISSNVTLTLTDANGVFSIEPTTIAASSISEETPVTVTVTFNSDQDGEYTGRIALTSDGAETQTVTLNAVVNTGGTASDAYLNIAKYASIDEAGATVTNMSSIYKYTEHLDDDCGWLTLSTYGAMQADANQKWLATTSLNRYNNTWSAQDVFVGNASYFTSSSTGYSIYGNGNQTFYVTNCTQVKALIKGGTANATMAIYECTVDANGTPTAASTATDTKTGNCSSSSPAVITSATIDASKVYMVRLTGGGSYPDLLEIGFQTPIKRPTIVVDPAELDFLAQPGESVTESVTVTGRRLTNDVTVTLTDENGVYVADVTSITIAEAEVGQQVNVTFNAPLAIGSFRGVLKFTSGETTASVGLFGSIGTKGTAYSTYLDVAKFSSIGANNWFTDIVDNPYKFTEYPTQDCAWLTLPVLMARDGWLYNDQNWTGFYNNYLIHKSETEGLDWSENDIFPGDDYYFTNTKSYGMGQVESSNTTMYYTYYNVTNCQQVKAYGHNINATFSTYGNTSYATFMYIYELTEEADGSLTMSETRFDSQTSSTRNADVVLTSATLDPTKIYRVYVGGYRSYMYEVGFKSSIPGERELAQIVDEADWYQYYRIVDGDLTGVWLSDDGKTLYCKDADGKAVNKYSKEDGQIDYVRDVAALMSKDYDQSNWVALHSSTELSTSLIGSKINGVEGTYTSIVNPTIELSAMPTAGADNKYEDYNVYVPCNFMSTEQESSSGRRYFFMTPKPMEVMTVHFAMWNGKSFEIPTSSGYSNQAGLVGDVDTDFSLYQGTPAVTVDDLTTGYVYKFTGLACKSTKPSSSVSNKSVVSPGHEVDNFIVYPLDGLEKIGEYDEHDIPTAIDELVVGRNVKGVTYYNVHGQASMTPFDGVNIVEVRYTDGSRKVVKIFK